MTHHIMPYLVLIFLLLLSPSFFLTLISSAPSPDPNSLLMNLLCDRTFDPQHCYNCCQSKPNTNIRQDARGLSGQTINCAHGQSLVLRRLLLHSAANSTRDDFVATCGDCVRGIDSAGQNLIRALLSWRVGDYGKCIEHAWAARQDFYDCALGLLVFRPLPPVLEGELDKMRAFTEVASAVVQQIA